MKQKFNPSNYIEIEELYHYFEKDKPAVKEFIIIVMDDLKMIQSEIFAAIKQKDIPAYKAARHKTLSALKLLKAIKLQELLIAGKEQLSQSLNPPDSVVFISLNQEFEGVLKALNYWKENLS